jgi:integrase
MRYLETLSSLFGNINQWSDEKLISPPVVCSEVNPAKQWRSMMKSSHKKEKPRSRVLSPEEWNRFKVHLSVRARAICEIALRRFLRLGDIKRISHLKIKDQRIEGIQQKTHEPYSVPVMENQPQSYDFTNFTKDFRKALVLAGMEFPKNHPLHCTPRDLRRTGATWAYHKTKDLRSIQKMLGHARLSTTERYLNVTYENLEGIATVVDEMANRACNRIATDSLSPTQPSMQNSAINS